MAIANGNLLTAAKWVLSERGLGTLIAILLLGLFVYERIYFETNQAALLREVIANQQRIIDMGLSNRQLILEDIRMVGTNAEALASLHQTNVEIIRALDRLEYRMRGVTGYPDDARRPGGGR